MQYKKLPLVSPQELGDGLILRTATTDDIDSIVELNIAIHENEGLGIWLEDATSAKHPSMDISQVLIITTSTGQIVSTLAFIPQVWHYENSLIPVGQSEAISTHPDYRKRGLSRKLIETVHRLSASQGNLIHAIVGISYYYRRYGYEYALDFRGRRGLRIADAPKDELSSPLTIRYADINDIPDMIRLHHNHRQNYLMTNFIDEARWQFDMVGHSDDSDAQVRLFCIVDDESIVGYYRTFPGLWDNQLTVIEWVMQVNIPYRQAMLSVLSAIKNRYTDEDGECHVDKIMFEIGTHHPLYHALPDLLLPTPNPSAWYIHIPSEARFIQHIAPILENRLSQSDMRGLTTTTRLNFYTHTVDIRIENGKITQVLPQTLSLVGEAGASFPPHVFNQLIMGYRSLTDIQYAHADCVSDTETTLLLNILFPQKPSFVIPLG